MRILLLLLLAVSQPGLAMELVTPSGKLQGALPHHDLLTSRYSRVFPMQSLQLVLAAGPMLRDIPAGRGYVMPLDLVQPVRNIPIRKVRFLHAPRNLPARIVCISTFGHQCRRATRYR